MWFKRCCGHGKCISVFFSITNLRQICGKSRKNWGKSEATKKLNLGKLNYEDFKMPSNLGKAEVRSNMDYAPKRERGCIILEMF